MKPIEFIAQDLFDKIRSRFYNLEMGDDSGAITSDPRSARFFDFDFVIEGNMLGRVSISINDVGSLKIFYGQGILDQADSIITKMWYDFLREMRLFAKRRLLRFDTRDITKSNLNKTDFGYLAKTGSKEQTMKESAMYGSSKSSYIPVKQGGTRLIIRHTGPIQTEMRGSRKRNIKSIYIENQDGERYKMPFNHIPTAEALAMHVNEGGRPYDEMGQAISRLGENVLQLSAFKRQVGNHDSMNTEANLIYERACAKLQAMREQLRRLSKTKYYHEWREGFQNTGDEIVLDQATLEDYKSKFTVNSFNEDLTQYFPLIHSIMQEAGTVDLEEYVDDGGDGVKESQDTETVVPEFAEFADWVHSIAEEQDTEVEQAALLDLMKNDKLSLGVDENNAIKSLENIGIDDPDLTDALESLGKVNPEADPKPVIMAWLQEQDPEMAADIARELGMDITAAATSAVPTAATSEPAAEPAPPAATPTQTPVAAEDAYTDSSGRGDEQDIEEMVKSFYDRTTGKFPIGETGVLTKVEKHFDKMPHARQIAEKIVKKLGDSGSDHELARIAQLSGTAMSRVQARAQQRK
jgi:hypothetical protein